MHDTARDALLAYMKEYGAELPFAHVSSTCREVAAECEFSASAIRKAYYRLLHEESAADAEARASTAERDTGDPKTESQADEDSEDNADPPPDAPQGLHTLERDYFYNEINDLYLIWIPCRTRPLQVEGGTIREMKRAYSQMPAGYDTINEIANAFGWRRKDFEQMKRALGWTHDEDPYTDEEHASTPTEDLVQDYSRLKRGEFERKLRKKEWAETVALANEYRAWREDTLDPFVDHVVTNPPRTRSEIKIRSLPQREFMAIFSPADVHLHKRCVDGGGFAEARDILLETTDQLIESVARHGCPEKSVLVLGNDWWHVDNYNGSTTRGTPQDVDGTASPEMVAQGYEVAGEIIDRIRTIGAPVDVVIVPSNHGRWSDYHMHAGLRFGYRGSLDVDVIGEPRGRQYIRYGRNLIGLTHGDGAKETDLPMIMAKESPEQWGGTRWRYWLTAHRHHLKEIDRGVIVLQAPSLAGKDRYHDAKGYVLSERANVCYIFDRTDGYTDRPIRFVD